MPTDFDEYGDFVWPKSPPRSGMLLEPSLRTLRHHMNAVIVNLVASQAAVDELAAKHEALGERYEALVGKYEALAEKYGELAARMPGVAQADGHSGRSSETDHGQIVLDVQGQVFDISVTARPQSSHDA
jgi:hypothetical protein